MSNPGPDPKFTNPIEKLLKAVEAFGADKLDMLAAAIKKNPEGAFRGLLSILLSVGPTPRFEKPTPQPVSYPLAVAKMGVTIAFSTNIYFVNKYTLQVFYNQNPTPLGPLNLKQNTNIIHSSAIDIPLAGSGDILMDGGIFSSGTGDYLLKVKANGYTSTLGDGVAFIDITVT